MGGFSGFAEPVMECNLCKVIRALASLEDAESGGVGSGHSRQMVCLRHSKVNVPRSMLSCLPFIGKQQQKHKCSASDITGGFKAHAT